VILRKKFRIHEIAARYHGKWSLLSKAGAELNDYCFAWGAYYLDGTETPGFDSPSFDVGGNLSVGQYINDPIDEEMVNFQLKEATDDEGKLLPFLNDVVCTNPSKKGDELYISYGTDYWMKPTNWNKLSQNSKRDMSLNYCAAWKKNSDLYDLHLN